MNVSGIVIKTTMDHLQDVIDNINACSHCEVHFHDTEGRIVATIEGKCIDEQMDRLKKIQSMPFIFSANLAYSYCEDELTRALAKMKSYNPSVYPDG